MYFLYDLLRLIVLITCNGLIWNVGLFIFFHKNNGKKREEKLQNIGKKLAITMIKAGPAFIKLGQFLSTRTDIVNQCICQSLESLQDKVAAISFSKIEKILYCHYNHKTIKKLNISQNSIASASIAQVHKGQWQNKNIALKIIKPGVRKKFAANMRLMQGFASLITKVFVSSKRLKLQEVVKVIMETSKMELDLMMEAASTDRIGKNTMESEDRKEMVYTPKVIWELCNEDILAIEWIDGNSIKSSYDRLTSQDKDQMVKTMLTSFFFQAYEDGFFHADWHLGNILLMSDKKLALLDYGIVCFLPLRDKLFVASILHGFLLRDYDKVAQLHLEAGYIPNETQVEVFALACRSIVEPIMESPDKKILMSTLLKRLFAITAKFGMETQPQLVLLQKNMVMLEGSIYQIQPSADLWSIIEPWIERWAKKNLSISAKLRSKSKKTLLLVKLFLQAMEELAKDIKMKKNDGK